MLEESQAESARERKLRERSEMYTKEIDHELEALKARATGRSPSSTSLDTSQEITKYNYNYYSIKLMVLV